MSRTYILSAVLLTAALAAPATAQLQAFSGDSPRMSTGLGFFDAGRNAVVGMICIQYGQPEWKDEYDNMLEEAKGKQFRLGKDFWTTFNTSLPMTIGGTKVPAGSYYLSIGCDEDGGFELIVLNAEQADKKGYTPFGPWKADHTCKMKKGKTESTHEKLTISLKGNEDDPTSAALQIAWGNHQLTAPVKVQIGGAKEAAGDKGKGKDK